MFQFSKKVAAYVATIIIVLTLTAQSIKPSMANSLDPPEKTLALKFLEKVIGLDIEAYNISSYSLTRDEEHIPGHLETGLSLVLTSKSGSRISVFFQLIDGMLTWCNLPELEGTPILKLQYADSSLDVAKGILRRYQDHFTVPYCQKLTPLLEKVERLDQLVESDEAVLRVKTYRAGEESRFSYSWHYKVEGIEAPRKRIGFTIRENGFLRAFIDHWGIRKIGSTTVKITEEEAIRIARETAKSYTQSIGAKIAKVARAELELYNSEDSGWGDCYTLYPKWMVELHFDKVYPGNIFGYSVFIWADTGEVFHADPQGLLGTPQPQPQIQGASWVLLVPIALFATSALAVLYRRRRLKVSTSNVNKIELERKIGSYMKYGSNREEAIRKVAENEGI